MNKIEKQIKQMQILAEPTVAAYREATFCSPATHEIGAFKLAEMPEFDPEIPMGHQDTFHMYSIIGQHSQNAKGDVTVFYSNTNPENEFVKRDPSKRYVIIADHATGKRLKVILPDVSQQEE